MIVNHKEHLTNVVYKYHPSCKDAIPKFKEIRQATLSLALKLHELCPASLERDEAQTKLEEVLFWANAAIARNECSVMAETDGVEQ